jgi:NADH-quinone oxidoreductase subunit M
MLLCLLALQFFIISAFTVQDLFFFFFCFEGAMIPLIIMILRCGPTARRLLAVKYIFVYTGLSGLLLFASILYVYKFTGTSDLLLLTFMPLPADFQIRCAILFSLAIGFKIPLYPFHL